MEYLEVSIKVEQEFVEILIAELGQLSFDSFSETEDGLNAYVQKGSLNMNDLEEVIQKYKSLTSLEYAVLEVESKNWNEEWEKNFEPVIVGDKCIVKASFHKIEKTFPFEITINPKMSFGTGHHETTYMMIENQLQIDFKGKKVMDAGAGTGILAILAEKLGAKYVLAFDIEDWAFENSKENANLNNCVNVDIQQGTIEQIQIPQGKFDVILANINKNVLLNEIPSYFKYISKGGHLLISGFYEVDIEDIGNITKSLDLIEVQRTIKNSWACILYQK